MIPFIHTIEEGDSEGEPENVLTDLKTSSAISCFLSHTIYSEIELKEKNFTFPYNLPKCFSRNCLKTVHFATSVLTGVRDICSN